MMSISVSLVLETFFFFFKPSSVSEMQQYCVCLCCGKFIFVLLLFAKGQKVLKTTVENKILDVCLGILCIWTKYFEGPQL